MLRQYCSAIFTATSTDTEPESLKNTVSSPAGVMSTSNCDSRAAGSCVSPPNITWFIVASWSVIARSSAGCPWPCIAVHHELIASRTSTCRPCRITVSKAPRAATATTGRNACAPTGLYGCQTCAPSIAPISSGVNAGTETEPNAAIPVSAFTFANRCPQRVQRLELGVNWLPIMMTLARTADRPAPLSRSASMTLMGNRKTGSYRHDLDGLRGVAIALVAIFHVWFGRVSGGVDVCLVLSGFFFGGSLLRTALTECSPTSPKPEIARLVRRLLPPLVVVPAASAVLTILIQPETRWETFADQSLASLGYFQNWELANTASDYLRAGEAVSPLQHIWSMSVQGQFYIAFLALFFSFAHLFRERLGKSMRIAFVALLSSLTIASFIYAIFAHDADRATAYYNSFARAWELLLGALVGAVVPYVRWPMWLRTSVAVVALAAILSCGALIDGVKEFPGPWALVPVGATMLLILAGANLQGSPSTG